MSSPVLVVLQARSLLLLCYVEAEDLYWTRILNIEKISETKPMNILYID